MTHAHAPTDADAWTALAAAHAQFADDFARFGESARAAILPWLRAAEHLARLLVFLIARGLALSPLKPRETAKTRPARPRSTGFRFTLPTSRKSKSRTRTRTSTRRWRARPWRDPDQDWNDYHYRDREAEALERARRSAAWAAKRAARIPAPPPSRDAHPPRPLTERLAALARVIADPHRLARRVARSLNAAAVQRLLKPERIVTDAPFAGPMLHVHDRAWTAARDNLAHDTS